MKLFLSEKDFLGKGACKIVYCHPEDISKCVKLSLGSSQDRDTRDELRYRKICRKNVERSTLLTKYYGTVETNFGTGYVYELVRDYDGTVSETFESFLSREKNISKIYELLQKFKNKLFEEPIVTRTLSPVNILIQHVSEKETQIRIVDDIGMGHVLIPFPYFSLTLAQSRKKNKWREFMNLIHARYGINVEELR